jgi:hypothetical protein
MILGFFLEKCAYRPSNQLKHKLIGDITLFYSIKDAIKGK